MLKLFKLAATLYLALLVLNSRAQMIIPDTSFSGDGLHSFTFYNNIDRVFGCAMQPDQKVVFAGLSKNPGTGYFELCITRFLLNGQPDTTFNGDGVAYVSMGTQQSIGGQTPVVKIAPDGKIVVANSGNQNFSSQDMLICRLDTNGVPDNSFNGTGILYVDITGTATQPDVANAMDFDGSGNIYVTGTTRWGGTPLDNDFTVVKITATGQLDPTFDGDGKKMFNPTGMAEFGCGIRVLDDGKIVVGATAGANMLLMKIDSTGAPDNTFNGNGYVSLAYGSAADMTALGIDGSNRILVTGYLSNGNALVGRCLQTGVSDATFGTSGYISFNAGALTTVSAMEILNDGKILVAGTVANGAAGDDFMVAQIDSTGAPDLSFNGTGYKKQSVVGGSTDESCNGMAVTADGRIFLAGTIIYSSAINEDAGLMLLKPDATTAVPDPGSEALFSISPNPAIGQVTIHSTVSQTVSVVDICGKWITTLNVEAGTGSYSLAPLNSGVYFLLSPGTKAVKLIIRDGR